jgi:hypothetical protein
LELNNEKYDEFLEKNGISEYLESLDDNLTKYYENLKKLENKEDQWKEKMRYIKSKQEPYYNDGKDKYNKKEENEYVIRYKEKYTNNKEKKEHFTMIVYNNISMYNNITLEMIKELREIQWDWDTISGHNNITLEMIKNNPDLPWDYEGVIGNKNIKFDDLKKYIIKEININEINWIKEVQETDKLLTGESLTLRTLQMNKGITEEDIINNPEINWNYIWLSSNCNMSLDFVLKNKELDWDVDMLFSRPTTTWDEIKNGELFYDDYDKENLLSNFSEYTKKQISKNKNTTLEIILNNLHEDWDWDYVTINPNVTLEIINNNPDKKWNKKILYRNPNVSIEELKENNIEITEKEEIDKILGFEMTCYDF